MRLIPEQKKYLYDKEGNLPHISIKKGEIMPLVLTAGDPGRIERMASFLEQKKLVNQKRGLLAYSGKYNGVPVSLVCSGMGAPSMAIVVEELFQAGARVFIRVGSCAAIGEKIEIGDLIIASAAVRDEGTSSYYAPENYPAFADPDLLESLSQIADKRGIIYHKGLIRTTDSFYEGQRKKEIIQGNLERNVIAFEMEASCLFVLASVLGGRAGCLLVPGANLVKEKSTFKGDQIDKYKKGEEQAIKLAFETIIKFG